MDQDIPMTGSPYSLHYRSDRVPGRKTSQSIKINLSKDDIPAPLEGIELTVTVAGQPQTINFPASANQDHTFLWDGQDAYDRTIQGGARATVDLNYLYNMVYTNPSSSLFNSFGEWGDPGTDGGFEFVGTPRLGVKAGIKRTWQRNLARFNASELGLGGWSLSVHHFYDPVNQVLYTGDGGRRSVRSIGTNIIENTAGGGYTLPYDGIGQPATEGRLRTPMGMCFGPAGDLYVAEWLIGRVSRIGPDGIRSLLAGQYSDYGFSGDGGPATEARLGNSKDVACGPDGSVYIVDQGNRRIRKVDPNGIITTVAGNGVHNYSGDGGPATEASLITPDAIAVGPDDSLYIASANSQHIRKVSPAGIITTVAGTGIE